MVRRKNPPSLFDGKKGFLEIATFVFFSCGLVRVCRHVVNSGRCRMHVVCKKQRRKCPAVVFKGRPIIIFLKEKMGRIPKPSYSWVSDLKMMVLCACEQSRLLK